MSISVVDDFLDPEHFLVLKETMMSALFPWFYTPYIIYKSEIDKAYKFQFTHVFYSDHYNMGESDEETRALPGYQSINSEYFNLVVPLIAKLNSRAMMRIKATLLTRTSHNTKFDYHVDYDCDSTTSIFYINTNDGYTEFKDGKKRIQSVENRLVTFPAGMEHTGTTCTDEKVRVVVNFNYF